MKVQHPIVPLEQIVSLVKRGESPKEGATYRQIGVRLWGKGSYERKSMDGGDTKYKILYKVKAADLIVNKIWARNGSVAIIPTEVDGCFVSSEFPTFELNKKKILPRWLHWITKTPILWIQFDVKSHGTSGKNRIQPNKILSAKIPLPDIEEQKYLLDLIEEIAVKHEKLINLHETSLGDVRNLRQAILQEAVQGNLVPQDSTYEPAGELLKRIKAEKEKLITEGKIKKQKPLLPITEDEIPYELPQGWEWVRLGELAVNIHYGFTASANNSVHDVRLLRITDIQNNKVNWNTVPGCEIRDTEIGKYELRDNDILIARTGGTIGKSFIVKKIPVKAVFASYLIRVIPWEILDADYIKLFLESPMYWTQLFEKSMGTGQPNVNASSLKQLKITLPPLTEQEHIVAKVDQLMHLGDELETRLNQSQKDSEMLMQAVLQEAFS